MDELAALAYGIGISEASKQRRIVPMYRSAVMMEFVKTHSAGQEIGWSIPLIEAYNRGVAAEISLQTRSEL